MEAHSFQGLKDLLKSPLPPKSNSFTRPHLCSTSLVEIDVLKKFKGSSSRISSSSSTLTFPISLPPDEKDLPQNLDTKNPIESLVENGRTSKHKMNLGKEMVEETEKKQSRTSLTASLIPPPISCLRHVKTGKSYTYLKFDEELDSYVIEEIKIPNRYLFLASRENGRLKLYLDLSAEAEE